MGGGTAAGLLAVLLVVVVLALAPAMVGLGMGRVPSGEMVAGFGGLAAVVGGAKLAAATWAVLARPRASHGALRASASID
jgi:hypothetical protein